jgi:hypothetical protein
MRSLLIVSLVIACFIRCVESVRRHASRRMTCSPSCTRRAIINSNSRDDPVQQWVDPLGFLYRPDGVHDATKEQKYLDAATHWAEKGEWTPQTTPGIRARSPQPGVHGSTRSCISSNLMRKIAAIKTFMREWPTPGRGSIGGGAVLYAARPSRTGKGDEGNQVPRLQTRCGGTRATIAGQGDQGSSIATNASREEDREWTKTFWSRGSWVVVSTWQRARLSSRDYRDRQVHRPAQA